jgi:death on curing protein
VTRVPVFLTTALVLEIHERLLEEHGGDPGLRDRGLLEAAVAMPRSTFGGAYLHPTLADMATAYHFHLSQNHPFVDGNKRIGVTVALTFLYMNDADLDASSEDLEAIAQGMALGDLDKAAVLDFYRTRVIVR